MTLIPGNTSFTLHNLPYGVISTVNNPGLRCATAYGNWAVDLSVLFDHGLFKHIPGLEHNVFAKSQLNSFASLSSAVRSSVRAALVEYLSKIDLAKDVVDPAFTALEEVQMHYPMQTHNFSDFYCSLEHTKNCTAIFSKNPINSNWYTIPSVYNGRTSSLVVSGTPVHRPVGVFPHQGFDGQIAAPSFQPETCFDFELEMGVFLTKPVPRGQRVKIDDAKDYIFGMVLLNDWSSRNIQYFEMPPLGPFHAKGSATSISPWIVPLEALEAVTCPRSALQEPAPLPHLDWEESDKATFNVELSVQILRDGQTYKLGQSNLNELHWTPLQQLTHLGSAGEGLATGDIFGTGTISSPRTNVDGEKIGLGCLYERKLSANTLSAAPPDIIDTFLQDGDEVIMQGWAVKPDTQEVLFGFGQCRGKVLPAIWS